VPLDASPGQIEEVAQVQGRIAAAPDEEIEAASRITEALLAHPLVIQAREAWQAGRCRRETPISWVEPDGTLVEGVLDLAFQDGDGWTILDFKTDRELGAEEQHYRRQVGLYAAALSRVTGKPTRGLLVRL